MALIAFPAGAASIEWTMPDPAAFTVRSGWTGRQTIGDLGGIRAGWQCKVTVAAGKVERARAWRAFAAAMRGPVNTTEIPIVEADQVASGALVNVASSTSTTLALTGLPASQTPYVPAGGVATIYTTGSGGKPRLVTLTAALNTNGSGAGTMTFEPAIAGIATGANVILKRPFASMRLAEFDLGWTVEPGSIYRPLAMTFEEVII